MSRSSIILVVVLIFSCIWFSTAVRACTPGPGGFGGWGWGGGIAPIFVGGGWDRGGWDKSSQSTPSSPSRSTGGSLRGGGISGGKGGK